MSQSKLKRQHTEREDLAVECARLRIENRELRDLLRGAGVTVKTQIAEVNVNERHAVPVAATSDSSITTEGKVTLFRSLFRGRDDVYPLRWQGKTGKSGYSPACGNEWRPGVCEKPRIKCSDCAHRQFLAPDDQVIFDHLSGRITAGVYPLLPDDTCWFLAVDFDDAEWRDDAVAFVRTCRESAVPASLEISRSGEGAHVWIFFSEPVSASEARRLGSALISRTCRRTRQLKLASYDRLFPNQDMLPKGGFGNLIALPLQKQPRDQGRSVFVDESLVPYGAQWVYLSSVEKLGPGEIAGILSRIAGSGNVLDVAFIAEEDDQEPWRRKPASTAASKLPGPLPEKLRITLANQIYVEKQAMPQPLANRLIRLAAFQNPEFYKAQTMRFPVWDKPRVIGCAENHPQHIALPRGCLDSMLALFKTNGIRSVIQEERNKGRPIQVNLTGTLRPEQVDAAQAMLKHETGVLCAPTAFGKTVTAAAIIARRGVNTLILVHRTELLNQWRERLQTFLQLPDSEIGVIGGGKHKHRGVVDIAVMQSLSRQGEVSDLVDDYGQIVVDECHHVSALSFESILKRSRAQYVLGLTATPVRRDGHHPIIFMQCGPVRHMAARVDSTLGAMEVLPRFLDTQIPQHQAEGIQTVFQRLSETPERNARIVADVVAAYRENRHVVVLTERTDHVDLLKFLISGSAKNLFVLHGRLTKKQRSQALDALNALPEDSPRVLLATGRLIGEGFDHARLDTLALALPISWKGTLQQYAGRLHREHAGKSSVRIYDYVDTQHPALARMWAKRQAGYRAMGYQIIEGGTAALLR